MARPSDQQERAARRFERIKKAYDVLATEASKQRYDTELVLLEARPMSARGALKRKLGSFRTEEACGEEVGLYRDVYDIDYICSCKSV